MPWEKQEVDDYLAAARDAGARVLLGFSRSRSPKLSRRKYLPSPSRLRREFLRLPRRTTRGSTSYLTWNEANHRGQPTWNRPDIVARYYDMLRRNCRSCTIVGPSVLDTLAMPRWVKAVERRTKLRVGIWALHNYIDANRFRTRGTRSLLDATEARTRRSGSRRPAGWCAATTARGSSSPTRSGTPSRRRGRWRSSPA